MNGTPIRIFTIAVFILSLITIAGAQQGTIQMNDGVTVSIRTVTSPSEDRHKSYGNIYSSGSEGTVHRIMTDRKNKIYFGYDLVVERMEDSGKFRVSIRPLSKSPDSLVGRSSGGSGSGSNETPASGVSVSSGSVQGKDASQETAGSGSVNYTDYSPQSLKSYPDSVIIEDGDSISIDILENPVTKAKISDVIKITYRSSSFGAIYSSDSSARDFTIDEVMLRMERPDIYINEEKQPTRSSIAGNIIWVFIPGKGRFIFSFAPQPEYPFTKSGMIEDNKILFSYAGDEYRLVSRSSILAYGGKWNLWVMHDPNYASGSGYSDDPGYEFGGASSVDLLFKTSMVMM